MLRCGVCDAGKSARRPGAVDIARQWLAGRGLTAWSVTGGLAGVAGGCAYSSFLLEWPLDRWLSPVGSFVSELEVRSQPHSRFFRLSDVVAGALVVVLAACVCRCTAGNWRMRVGSLLLSAVGVASVFDAAHPMPCTPSTDSACRRYEDTHNLLVQLHQGHTDSSVAGLLAAIGCMLLLAPLFRPYTDRFGWASASYLPGVVLAALAIAELGLTFAGGHGVGAVERLHVLLLSGWLVAIGCRLLAPPPGRPAGRVQTLVVIHPAPTGATPQVRPQLHLRT